MKGNYDKDILFVVKKNLKDLGKSRNRGRERRKLNRTIRKKLKVFRITKNRYLLLVHQFCP